MVTPSLHHILILTADEERSRCFYRDVLELRQLARPPFHFAGAWFQFGGGQHLHIARRDEIGVPRGDRQLDSFDVHFALGMSSYAKTLAWLRAKGFDENLPAEHPYKMILKAESIVGRPQIYIMDPDHNVIEFICDAMD